MSEQTPNTHPTKGKLRLKILLVVFGLALVALGYDFLVARPAVGRAFEKVEKAYADMASTPLARLTNTQVQELLGRQPSETYEEGPYTVELYSWTAGMPVGMNGPEAHSPGFGRRTHDYYAVFSKSGSELIFQTHFKFTMDTSAPETVADAETTPIEDMPSPMMMGGGGGPGGGGGGGGFDPAAIFARRDANEDGKLTGEELNGRLAERVEQLDTDKNGEISREEFDAGMQNRGGGRGPGGGGPGGQGGGGGGRDNRPERPQRPAIEDDVPDEAKKE